MKKVEIKRSEITEAELEFLRSFTSEKTLIRIVECDYSPEVLEVLRQQRNVKIIVRQLFCENVVEIEDDGRD